MITFAPFDVNNYNNCLIVTDETLAHLYNITGSNVFVLPCGESAKSFTWLQKLCSFFLAHNLDKNGTVVAVGGGSVGDVVGLSASIYKRGVNLLLVPTTIIAMADSSIGGKTAIDLDGVKNAVGSYVVADTLIDVRFLNTLPCEQVTNGLGEIIKYCILTKDVADVFEGEVTAEVIKRCVEYKQQVVSNDMYDQGVRKYLNLGHTLGHAMELEYNLCHGVAVANGIFYELNVSCNLGLLSKSTARYWQQLVTKYFSLYPVTDTIIDNTVNDKKNADGKTGFVLLTDDGIAIKYIDIDQIKKLC